MYTEKINQLQINVYDTRDEMGAAAGQAVASTIKQLLERQETVRIIFAAAPSQQEMLAYLRQADGIDWLRITAFHMDEYIGLAAGAPQHFSQFLLEHIFDAVNPGQLNLIRSDVDAAQELERYATLISDAPIDIVCLGIGENGHIAFNDPPVADFHDKLVIKQVELDEACRQQQVNDKCFDAIEDVPTHAMTLTIPTLMSARYLFCTVPGKTKYEAVQQVRKAPLSTDCPATILRHHDNCIMYTDWDAYGSK